MDEDTKKAIAVFRFGVIADLVGRKLSRGEKERMLREKAYSQWDIPFSTRSHISRSTILSWVRAYEKGRRLDKSEEGQIFIIDFRKSNNEIRTLKCQG